MMKKLFATFALSALAIAAHAGGMESLENFIRTAKSGHAEFTQVITAPSRNGEAPRTKSSSGTFDFQRPSHFRAVTALTPCWAAAPAGLMPRSVMS